MEHNDLIATGTVPPEVPIFHLVRAVHMAGRCIDCGLCEDACPVDIPLRLLYRKVNQVVSEYCLIIEPECVPINLRSTFWVMR